MSRRTTRLRNFTQTNLANMRSDLNHSIYYFDTKVRGLAVSVSPLTDRKTFYFKRKVNGKKADVRIGHYPEISIEDARAEAERLAGEFSSGLNPSDRRRAERLCPTLGEIFTSYIEAPTRGKVKRQRSAKTIYDYRYNFDHFLDDFRHAKLTDISRKDIEDLVNRIGKSSQTMANRVLGLLKALLNYGMDLGYIQTNPAARFKEFEMQTRDRWITPEEFPKVWKAIEEDEQADWFKLAIFTGARRGDICKFRFDKWEGNCLTIPKTKNGKPVVIGLIDEAIEILTKRRAETNSDWIFPNEENDGPIGPPKRAWERIKKRCGISDITIHDLRRTLASWQANQGKSLSQIASSLGQGSVQATPIYARIGVENTRKNVGEAVAAMLATTKVKPE